MMKPLPQLMLFTFLLISTPSFLCAQYSKPNRQYQSGDTDVMAGFGILPTFMADKVRQELPAISLRVEHRVVSNYSLALEVSHSVSTSRQEASFGKDRLEPQDRQYRNAAYYLSLRNAVHCNCERLPDWDIYGGMALTYYLMRISRINGSFGEWEQTHDIQSDRTQFNFTGFVGARYAPAGRLSFYGEAGFGISLLRLGIGYKL